MKDFNSVDYFLFGGGGFSREVLSFLSRDSSFKVIDTENEDSFFSNRSIINPNVIIPIGDPTIRFKVYEKIIKKKPNSIFPNLFLGGSRQEEQFKRENTIGYGNIFCKGSLITTGILIGNFNLFNLNSTIGHDCCIGDFCTISPGVNVSGCTKLGNFVYMGTNSCTVEGNNISSSVTIGAGGVVNRNIEKFGTYVGVPVKKINGEK